MLHASIAPEYPAACPSSSTTGALMSWCSILGPKSSYLATSD